MPSIQLLLDLSNGQSRVQVLRTCLGAVHDGVASEHLEGVVQVVQTLLLEFISRIINPFKGLLKDGRA